VNMQRGMSPTRAKTLAVALTLLIFGLDYGSPGDINASIFYVCVVVTFAWTQSPRWLWGGAAVVTMLSIVALPMGAGPVGHPDITLQDWINRLITASMLMLTAGFAYVGIRMSRQLDANEQLMAESAARERAEKALRERNALIRRLVESNIIGIFFWDSGGCVTEANDAFLQTVGYSRHDLLSGQFQRTDLSAPDFRAAELRAIVPELERLHQLARLGNMRDIAQWAGQVAELDERYRPFADQLRLMANGYQSKAILTFVERYLEGRQAP
jgi:PAS domain-containing protein